MLKVRTSPRQFKHIRSRSSAVGCPHCGCGKKLPSPGQVFAAVATPCFSVIRWGGEVHHFGTREQREVIRLLFAARGSGHDWVSGLYLLAEADCEAAELRDVFKGHKTWRRLIQPATEVTGVPAGAFRIRSPLG